LNRLTTHQLNSAAITVAYSVKPPRFALCHAKTRGVRGPAGGMGLRIYVQLHARVF